MPPSALIVDDDAPTLAAIAEWVGKRGFRVRTAENVRGASQALEEECPDLLLLDLQLPDGSGLDLIGALEGKGSPDVVVLTGHGSVDSAVEAIRGGAVDYLTKPVDLKRLEKILRHVLRSVELRSEVASLRGELRSLGRFGQLNGASPPMKAVYDLIEKVAPTDSTVLIIGETGTGKELVARTVHDLSPRARKPFLPINSGAMQPTLIESELFGHEKGSFTGADRQRRGIFEQADGGTLFLDEITEMSAELQVKLLRVLETGTLTRIGGEEGLKVDVRLIAATNRDPEQAVRQGKLREDLLYRLLVFPIRLPALRGRGDDIRLLAGEFLRDLNEKNDTRKELTDAALRRLRDHPWPGNVRELKNIVERAYIVAGDRIDAPDIPMEGRSPSAATASGGDLNLPVGISIAEAERRLILATLDRHGGDKKVVAKTLGISLKTLYSRLSSYRDPGSEGER